MKKKLALIVISLDECFTEQGFSGGGHKVTKNLIMQLVTSDLFDIDIYCKKGHSWSNTVSGINSITVLDKKAFRNLEKTLADKNYDYILSSDVLLPFANNLIHSNSSRFKTKNGKNRFLQRLLKIYNYRKIKNQETNMSYNKAVFTVSESLKNDYVENFKLDPKNVFVCHPAIDELPEFETSKQNDCFTIGSMVGGGINKGGYLLLLAFALLPKSCKIKARFIYPKYHKSGFFRFMVKLLNLSDKIEVIEKQSDMKSFYETIDCYVLPSLNEAFGLVVTEAASYWKPSIVSSTTGVRELIIDNINGFVFDREINKISNLTEKLEEVSNMYIFENEKFVEIAKNAHKIAEKLDWKEFGDTIMSNMIKEK